MKPEVENINEPQNLPAYGSRPKTKAVPISVTLLKPEQQNQLRVGLCLGQLIVSLVDAINEVTVPQQLGSTEMWLPENALSPYLLGVRYSGVFGCISGITTATQYNTELLGMTVKSIGGRYMWQLWLVSEVLVGEYRMCRVRQLNLPCEKSKGSSLEWDGGCV